MTPARGFPEWIGAPWFKSGVYTIHRLPFTCVAAAIRDRCFESQLSAVLQEVFSIATEAVRQQRMAAKSAKLTFLHSAANGGTPRLLSFDTNGPKPTL